MTLQNRIFSFETRKEALDYIEKELEKCFKIKLELCEAYDSISDLEKVLQEYLSGIRKMGDSSW